MARAHVNTSGGLQLHVVWDICIRYFTPAVLLVIVIQAFMGELRKAYGGYSADALILFGVDWLVLTIVVSVLFTFYPWKREKLKKRHHVAEDQLLT